MSNPMDLAKTLERLSAAATQGELFIEPGANSHCFDGQLVVGGRCIAFVEGDQTVDEDGEYHIVADPDGQFLVELWNAYRTGQLIVAQAGVQCVGCEGKPAPENNPCAVCGLVDHPQATSPVDDRGGAVCEQQSVEVPRGIVEFLYGRAPLKGFWFGDKNPTERGAFWWRKYLPALGDEA